MSAASRAQLNQGHTRASRSGAGASANSVGTAALVVIGLAVLTACSAPAQDGSDGTPSAAGVDGVTRPRTAEGPYTVDRVVDGDTVRVFIDGRSTSVRLIGIDTPETKDPRKPVECFGEEASRRAQELLAGSRVWLEYDPTQGREDRYGRELAFVWTGETLVNEVLVREGFAHEYTYDATYKYRDIFLGDEVSAERQERGLWSPTTCAGDTTQAAR